MMRLSEKEKFAERLNNVLHEERYPVGFEQRQTALAHAFYVDPDVISAWLAGVDFPKTSELVKLSQLLKVRTNWLLLAIGGKLDNGEDNVQLFYINETSASSMKLPDLSQDAYDVAQNWMKFPQQQCNALAILIKSMVIHQFLTSSDQLKENPRCKLRY